MDSLSFRLQVSSSLSLWERVGVRDEVSAEEKYSLKSPSYLPKRQLRGNSQSPPKQFRSQPGFDHYSAALRECPLSEISIPCLVMLPLLVSIVNSTITFDYQLRFTAIKVSNVSSNLVLTSELESEQLAIAKQLPQNVSTLVSCFRSSRPSLSNPVKS